MKRKFALVASVLSLSIGAVAPAAVASPTSDVQALSGWTDTYSGGGWGYLGWASVAGNPSTGKSAVLYFADHAAATPSAYRSYHVQIVNADGSPSGSPIDLSASNDNYYYYAAPVISYNPSTEGWTAFVVYGSDTFSATNPPEVRSHEISQAGALVGSPNTVIDPVGDSFFRQAANRFYSSSPSAPWDPQEQRFLYGGSMYDVSPNVTSGNDDDNAAGLFVGGDGQPVTGDMKLLTDFKQGCCGVGMDFSTKSRNYLVAWWGDQDTSVQNEWGPITQLLDEDGNRIGTPDRLIPDELQSVGVATAYNAARDEFIVTTSISKKYDDCSDVSLALACGVYAFRVGADDGQLIGDPIPLVTTTSTEDLDAQYRRPQIAVNGDGDEFMVTWTQGSWSAGQNVWARRASGNGTMIDSEPQNVSDFFGGEDSVHQRPAVGFDAKSCQYQLAWQYIADINASTKPQNIAGRTYSSVCKSSAKKKPSIRKLGTPGSTSAKVKVGCGGSGKCTIKLSGKLKGGSGKIVSKTIKVKAGKKATVKVRYTKALIDELASNGGGKIKLTARQVGGKSSTIVLTVPSSVTG